MKTEQRSSERPLPIRLASCLLSALAVLSLASIVNATPVISGDPHQIVTIDPAVDCVGCTAQELDVLERGVGMMLTEMYNVAEGAVCVAEASLARDLAVVTFEAYRSGAVSENRWRDSVRYKGRFSARLTQQTIDTMLLAYREALEGHLGIAIPPGSFMALQTDIWASAQLSRLFRQIAAGYWQSTFLPVLEDPRGGFNRTVDTLLGLRWSGRPIYFQILMYSRIDAHWREAELERITTLQPDFLVGGVGASRDQLLVDYRAAMAADPWETMAWGCGLQASEGFRRHALALSEGLSFIALPSLTKQWVDSDGRTIQIHDSVLVTAEMPSLYLHSVPASPAWFTSPRPVMPSFGPIGHGGGGGRGGGSGGGHGNGGGMVPLPPAPTPDVTELLRPSAIESLEWPENPAAYGCDQVMDPFNCGPPPNCSSMNPHVPTIGTPCVSPPVTCNDLLLAAGSITVAGSAYNVILGRALTMGTTALAWLCAELGPGGRL
ncbi:MAG: hypothetical protein AAGD38_15445 [Acidobacteriota bacterium]